MTTPENFRRRQRIEGAFLILLAIFSIGYGIWDNRESKDRDVCMADSFRQSGEVQEKRAELAEQTTRLDDRVDRLQTLADGTQERLIEDVFAAEGEAEAIRAFVVYQRAVEKLDADRAHLDERQAKLLQRRQSTKIPPFPTGTCE